MRYVIVNGFLMVVMGAAIVGLQLFDRSGAAVEGAVRRYASAVSNSDLDTALAEIAPQARADWTEWVRSQLGNVYDVRGIAVRSPSVLDRVVQRLPGGPFEVTAVMDIDRDFPEDYYQATPTTAVEEVDGRWYLSVPLLAKPERHISELRPLNSIRIGVPSNPNCSRSVLSR